MTKKWDEHKAVIVSLYLEQSKPLHEVQRIMEEEHNFKASWVSISYCIHTPSRFFLSKSAPDVDQDTGIPHAVRQMGDIQVQLPEIE